MKVARAVDAYPHVRSAPRQQADIALCHERPVGGNGHFQPEVMCFREQIIKIRVTQRLSAGKKQRRRAQFRDEPQKSARFGPVKTTRRRNAALHIGVTVTARQITPPRHMPNDHRNVRRAFLGIPQRITRKRRQIRKQQAGYIYHAIKFMRLTLCHLRQLIGSDFIHYISKLQLSLV